MENTNNLGKAKALMFAKLTFALALILMLCGMVTVDTEQISYAPSAPARLGLVAAGVVVCLVSILLNRQNTENGKGGDNP